MKNNLFRKEVLAAQQTDRMGGIQLQPPSFGWVFQILGLVCLAGVLSLLFFGRYTQKEYAYGTLVPEGGLLTLTPVAPGVVTRIYVKEGDHVKADEPMMEISGEQESVTMGGTKAAVTEQLRLKKSELESNRDALELSFRIKEKELNSRLEMLQSQKEQIDSQVALQKQRAQITQAMSEKWEGLAQTGYVTKLQALQQHDAALQSQLQVRELNRQALDLGQQLLQTRSELLQLPTTEKKQKDDLMAQISDTVSALTQNEAQRAIVLRAPSEGIVSSLMVHPGQPVTPQQSTLTLLPYKSSLQAELWVPSRAVGFVKIGDRVIVRYQAYPYQKFGDQYGTVAAVSRSALVRPDINKLTGQDFTEARYRVLVNLDKQDMPVGDRSALLKPGMDLESVLVLDRRRLIDWIADPLLSAVRPTQVRAEPVEGKT